MPRAHCYKEFCHHTATVDLTDHGPAIPGRATYVGVWGYCAVHAPKPRGTR